MYPYYIEPDNTAAKLYQLKDGRFQIIEAGQLTPFLPGHGYLLVEKELANFLQELKIPGVTFCDAVIWDSKNNKEYHSHKQVIVTQHFSSDQIDTLNLDRDHLLVMGNEYIFVSPMLKDKLESSQFNYLKFSEGLSLFA